MVNLLEALYVVPALAAVSAIVAFARHRRGTAGRWGVTSAACAGLCVTMYWYLGRT
jgi:hypothetical protein